MPEITIQPLSNDVAVAPQMHPDMMAAVAQAGFKSVVNNRPDFEGGPDQPTSDAMRAAALAAGLVYEHLPVQGAYQSPEQVAEFAKLLATLPKPMLAFCRSGARSSRLYAQAIELS